MVTKPMTQAELQNIEHATKILQEHQEVVQTVVNETEALLNNYGPIMRAYVDSITRLQKDYTDAVVEIIRSTRELKVVISNTQNLHNFMDAISKLEALLTPELVEKLKGLVK